MSLVKRVKEEFEEARDKRDDLGVKLSFARREHGVSCSNPGSKEEKALWEKVENLSRRYTMYRHRVVQLRGKLRMAEAR